MERGPLGVPERGGWVGVERSLGKCFMVEMLNRTLATLHALILQWIKPGMHIVPDGWRACNSFNQAGGHIFGHVIIQNNSHFADPRDTPVHTQNVENLWMQAKRSWNGNAAPLGTCFRLTFGNFCRFRGIRTGRITTPHKPRAASEISMADHPTTPNRFLTAAKLPFLVSSLTLYRGVCEDGCV